MEATEPSTIFVLNHFVEELGAVVAEPGERTMAVWRPLSRQRLTRVQPREVWS